MGDRRHSGDREEAYRFTPPERLGGRFSGGCAIAAAIPVVGSASAFGFIGLPIMLWMNQASLRRFGDGG